MTMSEEQKTNIIGKAEVSKEKMMAWAKSKNNNEEYLFVMDLILFNVVEKRIECCFTG